MKKTIAAFLLLLIVLSLVFSTTLVYAEDSGEYSPNYITVDYAGKLWLLDVFYDDEQIYVPVNVLSMFGGMDKKINGHEIIFYYQSQEYSTEFIKEVRISQSSSLTTGEIWIFRYSNGIGKIISSKRFSGKYTDTNGDLYLPLAELLPFLDADVQITEEGILQI